MKRAEFVEVVPGSSASFLSLFSGMRPRQLHVQAVFQGDSPGHLYVDSRASLHVGCLLAGDACYLVGTSNGSGSFDAVNELLPRDRPIALFAGDGVAPDDIERATRGLYAMPARRRAAFLGGAARIDWAPPDEMEIVPIDARLFALGPEGIDEVREEVVSEWGTLERFLERGFGSAVVSEGRVAASSIADYVVGNACEIGVHVDSGVRRRGLGTAVAAATAREAFRRGLDQIVWHSWANNAGSIAISRRLGFGDEVFYTVHFNHWAAENQSDLTLDEFRSFGEAYERLFAERPPAESGYPYVVAATAFASARDRKACLRSLGRAIDVGWLTSIPQLRKLWPELFSDPTLPERVPEWKALFARLGAR